MPVVAWPESSMHNSHAQLPVALSYSIGSRTAHPWSLSPFAGSSEMSRCLHFQPPAGDAKIHAQRPAVANSVWSEPTGTAISVINLVVATNGRELAFAWKSGGEATKGGWRVSGYAAEQENSNRVVEYEHCPSPKV